MKFRDPFWNLGAATSHWAQTHPEGFRSDTGALDPIEPGIEPHDAAGQCGQRSQPVLGEDELLQGAQQPEGFLTHPGDEVASQVYSLQLL